MIKHDTYTIYARFFPALISAAPLFVLWYFVLKVPDWKGLCEFLISIKCLGTISLSVVFLYFYSQFIRIMSKYFERKYFTGPNAAGFPSTYFMSFLNAGFSTEFKTKFRERVKKAFKMQLLDAAEETREPAEARNRITEAFDQIRLKVGDGKLVLKQNIWYGFSRNLIGGAIFSSIFCAFNLVVGILINARPLVHISTFLLVAYILIFAFRRAIMVQNAESYARQLIAEFMKVTTPRR